MNSLIVSAVHRPDPHFSQMLSVMVENQCQVFVFNTGGENWTEISPIGANVVSANRHINYYEALVAIKGILKAQYPKVDCVTLVHSDVVISDATEHKALMQSFVSGEYDFVACYSHPVFYDRQGHSFLDSRICTTEQKIQSSPLDAESFYYSPACPTVYPDPYYQGGYLTISSKAFQSIPDSEFGNGRLMVRYLYEHQAKFGAIEAFYKEDPYRMEVQNHRHTTQYGRYWIHVGDILKLQYAAQGINVRLPNISGPYNAARLGYLLLEEEQSGRLWPEQMRPGLMKLVQDAGGVDKVLSEFRRFAVGTPLERW